MGLFDVFGGKANKPTRENEVIGFLRLQTSKHLGIPVNSPEFDAACKAAGEALEKFMLPNLDKRSQQPVLDTLSAACPSRSQEAFGEYLVLLWVRFGVIQRAISAGKVKPEEATIEILIDALHKQIRQVAA